jgi:hypothetical protein
MAKVDTAERIEKPKKKKKKSAAAGEGVKVKTKKAKSEKAGKERKGAASRSKADAFDGIARFVDHPMVADLLAAGAMAAVAAIAEHQLGNEGGQRSSKMVKSVGKAAATAMGRKLIGDIGAITTAATDAVKKA